MGGLHFDWACYVLTGKAIRPSVTYPLGLQRNTIPFLSTVVLGIDAGRKHLNMASFISYRFREPVVPGGDIFDTAAEATHFSPLL